MIRLICLLIGYLLGMFQTAYFYGKMHGIDIRTKGSGNAGTTNTLRVLGKKAGMIVLLGDLFKTMLAILIVKIFFCSQYPELYYLLVLYAAAGAILGHNFPFYLNFKGGKGIAATGGLILSFHPWFILVGVISFFGTFFITHYVSLASLLAYLCFMIQLVYCGETGFFEGMTEAAITEMYVVGLCLLIMAYWRHRSNIVKLIKGTERKTYLTKKNKTE